MLSLLSLNKSFPVLLPHWAELDFFLDLFGRHGKTILDLQPLDFSETELLAKPDEGQPERVEGTAVFFPERVRSILILFHGGFLMEF